MPTAPRSVPASTPRPRGQGDHEQTHDREPDGLERRSRKWRGRATTIGLIVAGVLIVAVHLGMFGTTVAISIWTGWATNLFLALVLLKVLDIVAHVVLGGVVLRHPAVGRVIRGKTRVEGK